MHRVSTLTKGMYTGSFTTLYICLMRLGPSRSNILETNLPHDSVPRDHGGYLYI